VVEERRLPDARFAVQHEDVALTRANVGKEAVENVDLAVPTAKLEPVPHRLITASVIPSIARSLSASSSVRP